jgi:hypothetical protein
MTKILREPLVYFLLVGLGLFVLFDVVASDEAAYDSRVINVDRDALRRIAHVRAIPITCVRAPSRGGTPR